MCHSCGSRNPFFIFSVFSVAKIKNMKDFLSIYDCSSEQLDELLRFSTNLKNLYKAGGDDLCLSGKVLAMLFEKPSLRTRISFHVAMTDLGGSAIYVKPEDIGGMGKREPQKL